MNWLRDIFASVPSDLLFLLMALGFKFLWKKLNKSEKLFLKIIAEYKRDQLKNKSINRDILRYQLRHLHQEAQCLVMANKPVDDKIRVDFYLTYDNYLNNGGNSYATNLKFDMDNWTCKSLGNKT